MAEVMYLGEVGTPIIVTVTSNNSPRDVSAASVREIVFERPDGTTANQAASLVTDGTDGQIQYVTTSGFIDQRGRWRFYAHVAWAGGSPDFSTDPGYFHVL